MPTFLWPLKKSLTKVSQSFGEIWIANSEKLHTGIDIPANAGEFVRAVASGTITKIGDLGVGWGRYVVLEHDAKDYCTSYLHVDTTAKVGLKFKAGDVIGSIANISGPHLHFNVWQGPANSTLTQRGALPTIKSAGKITPQTDPAFPDKFINPSLCIYEYIEDKTKPAKTFVFKQELKKGISHPDVKILQQVLNSDSDTRIATTGPGSPGNEVESFGGLTEKAVQRFQIKHSIATASNPSFGIVGPKTRTKLNEIYQQIA